jgi:predicted transcriptional regulator
VPILKAPPQQSKNESLQLRVSTDFKLKLQQYAEFLNATPSYVVTEALDRIFRKDHEFRAWLEQHSKAATMNQTQNKSAMEMTSKS